MARNVSVVKLELLPQPQGESVQDFLEILTESAEASGPGTSFGRWCKEDMIDEATSNFTSAELQEVLAWIDTLPEDENGEVCLLIEN